MAAKPDPCFIVIFGASGDLTSRKLIPALYEMAQARALPEGCRILGISRTPLTDAQWRDKLTPWARKHAKGFNATRWRAFSRRIHYFAGDAAKQETYAGLQACIESLAQQFKVPCNILFYLSVAPRLYEPIIGRIETSGLVTEGKRWCSLNAGAMPWQRIIVEKPFGHDAESAASLNRALGRAFEEQVVIQHYATEGIFEFEVRTGESPKTGWVARKRASGQTLTLWFVARDDRGGVTWTQRQVRVQ